MRIPETTAGSRQDQASFSLLFSVEDKHFWFRSRNKTIQAIVTQVVTRLPADCRVLEIGCGTGNVLRVLEGACPNGTVIGLDRFTEGLRYAGLRTSADLVQGDARALPFGRDFHVICLFDVLEHLPDDLQVLRNVHAMLTTNGVLMLTVPAHQRLWSHVDVVSKHYRRYETGELKTKLFLSGYRLEYLSEYMMSIYPFVLLRQLLSTLSSYHNQHHYDQGCTAQLMQELAYDELRIIPVVNSLMAWLLAQEAHIIARRKQLPMGTSILALARKDIAPAK